MHYLTRTLARAALALGLAASVFPSMAQTAPPIAHRYSFTTNVVDSVGGANGAALQRSNGGVDLGLPVTFENGEAVLDGAGGYIDLPNGMFSKFTNITIETWVTLTTTATWSRIWDFGNSSNGETGPDAQSGNGTHYIFLAASVNTAGTPRFAFHGGPAGGENPVLNDPTGTPLPRNEQIHTAVTYGNGLARMFVNGRLISSGNAVYALTNLVNVNNWLGRSLYQGDSMTAARYNEFRVHSNVLSGLQIKASALGSPDSYSYDPGVVTNLTMTVAKSEIAIGEVQTPTITGFFTAIGETVILPPDVTVTSSAPSVVSVSAAGVLRGLATGTATLTASRDGRSAQVTVTVSPPPPAVLKHRYSFNAETNTQTGGVFDQVPVIDSIGAQNGTAIGGVSGTNMVIFTNGAAVFPSVTGANPNPEATYIDLPDGLVSSKTNITIETWISSAATTAWQRVFDFGSSSTSDPHIGRDPNAAPSKGYMFLTVRNTANPRFAARPNLGGETVLDGTAAMTLNREYHFVCVFAPQFGTSAFYIDGVPIRTNTAPFPLSSITDNNNWLAASMYGGDNPFIGAINEFRIYEGALNGVEVALSRNAGPNALAGSPGTLTNVVIQAVPTLLLSNNVTTQLTLRGNFQNVTNVDVTGAGATYTSGNTAIFTVTALGAILPRAAGSANLIADLNGVRTTNVITVVGPTAFRQTVTNQLFAGQVIVNSGLQADYGTTATNVNVNAFNGITHSSSDTNVLTIAANGNITAIAPGTATITANYGGITATRQITVVLPNNFQRGTLVNRYSFDGTPDAFDVLDSVGGQHGFVMNGAGTNFTGAGQLALPGGANGIASTAPYVNLPNDILSNYTAVTFEAWVNVRANTANTRIFDFGMSSGAPNPDGSGTFLEDAVGGNPAGRDYIFLTPFGTANPRFAMRSGATAGETPNINTGAALPLNTMHHLVAVIDPPNGVARLYLNGVRMATGAANNPLSVVDDRNVWLGRSQFTGDPMLNGVFDEFRIYNGPMLDSDVRESFLAGPNNLPVVNNARLTVTRSGNNLQIRVPSTETGFTLQSATSLSGTPPSWGNVAVTPTTDGGSLLYTVPINATGNVFYRLNK